LVKCVLLFPFDLLSLFRYLFLYLFLYLSLDDPSTAEYATSHPFKVVPTNISEFGKVRDGTVDKMLHMKEALL
jgi:hypothetical protein